MKQRLILFCIFIILHFLLIAQSPDSVLQETAVSVSDTSLKADSIRQVDLVDYLVKILKVKDSQKKRDDRKVRFTLFPSESNISGGKTVFTSFNVAFLLGDIANTNVSTVYFVPYIGMGGQYGFQLQPNIWLNKNSWNFTGEYFILNYPQNTWGLGGNSPDEAETLIDYKHFRVHQNAMKEIFPDFVIGLGYSLDSHYDIQIEDTEAGLEFMATMHEGKDNSISSGITLPMIYDSRQNSINPTQGFMSSFTYSFFHPAFGSDDEWQSVFFDNRKYFSFAGEKSKILAFRAYYWSVVSGQAPYLDLPANRWEPISGSASRGIRQNRYRSNALLYFETEYRFGITANGLLGGVVFANVVSASQYDTQHFYYWHPAAGVGVRVKFNKYSRSNVTFDFGFSKG
ncbi:MAG: BamA/TamA family outer membrane protein, partial [Lentimicrobium sp.]|nr:BamA/TamA family outer membrane protein [Lentimicrobium sp.]